MGTRPGALDPGVVLYLFQGPRPVGQGGRDDALQEVGPAGHLRHQQRHARPLGSAEPDARLAVDYFVYRAAKEIGALAAVLGGIDGLVFTAGIGENSAEIRQRICEASAWLGIELDADANAKRTRASPPSTAACRPGSIPTNEELMIARHTGALLGLDRSSAPSAAAEKANGTSWPRTQTPTPSRRWAGLPHRSLAERDQRPRLHPAELRAVRRRRVVPGARPHRAHEDLGRLTALFVEERKKGVLDVSQIPARSPRTRPATSTGTTRSSSACRPTRRSSARSCRTAASGWSSAPQDLRLRARSARGRGLHQVSQDAQRRVFDAYTADVRRCRSSHILTGLPDAYGRGRIIGDYRRVALYGVARLIERKQEEKRGARRSHVDRRHHPRPRGAGRADPRAQGTAADGGELRVRYLGPARPRRKRCSGSTSAISPAVKEQNGAAMSLGRTSTFLDIYFERDLAPARSPRTGAGDHRRLRDQAAHRPVSAHAGVRRAVRRRSDLGHRVDWRHGRRRPTAGDEDQLPFLQTLYNLGPAPEPNLTIWYSPRLPDGLPRFAAKVAIDTSSIQFESDEIMRRAWGDDGAIACCVSPMLVGKQMQFFGARANLAKCLLYAINGGRDEISGEQVGPAVEPVKGDVLDFDDVLGKFEQMMDWLAGVYVNAMNVIHYMHDKYAYERIEMALHDYAPLRTMAFGMAGCRSWRTACRRSSTRRCASSATQPAW